MRAVRAWLTGPELDVLQALARSGDALDGAELNAKLPIPRRRADVAWRRERVALFVDGCFWHACPACALLPLVNRDYWQAKLMRNAARDADTAARLRALGWVVLRHWEHEDPAAIARRAASIVGQRRKILI